MVKRMHTRSMSAAFFLLLIAGCGRSNVSGTYVMHDNISAAKLQLTESPDEHVMGNMTLFRLMSDGGTDRTDLSITDGRADSRSQTLALTMKANEPFAQGRTVSGTTSNQGIDLSMLGRLIHLSPAKPDDFDAAVTRLAEIGDRQRQIHQQVEQRISLAQAAAKKIADEIGQVVNLTKAVSSFNAWVYNAKQGPDEARANEEHLVEFARRDLLIVRDFKSKHQGYEAAQGQYRIAQLAYQMSQIKYAVDQETAHEKKLLANLDSDLQKNPCNSNLKLEGCDALAKETTRYQTSRTTAINRIAQLSSDLEKNRVAIDVINKQATRSD